MRGPSEQLDERTINGKPILVLRDVKPPKPPPKHECPVFHDKNARVNDKGMIIQCECGKRYKCVLRHIAFTTEDVAWKRRILPWPPRNKTWRR